MCNTLCILYSIYLIHLEISETSVLIRMVWVALILNKQLFHFFSWCILYFFRLSQLIIRNKQLFFSSQLHFLHLWEVIISN